MKRKSTYPPLASAPPGDKNDVSFAVTALQLAMSSGIRQRRAKETSSGRMGRRYDCPWKALRATLIPAAFFLVHSEIFTNPS
jgi:hypothetical protein